MSKSFHRTKLGWQQRRIQNLVGYLQQGFFTKRENVFKPYLRSVLESLFNEFAVLQVCNFIKRTQTQLFSCQCFKIFKNTYLEEHLQTTASVISFLMIISFSTILPLIISFDQHTGKTGPKTLRGSRTQDPMRTQDLMRTQDSMRSQDPTRSQNPLKNKDPMRTHDPTNTEDPMITHDPMRTQGPLRTQEPIRTWDPKSTNAKKRSNLLFSLIFSQWFKNHLFLKRFILKSNADHSHFSQSPTQFSVTTYNMMLAYTTYQYCIILLLNTLYDQNSLRFCILSKTSTVFEFNNKNLVQNQNQIDKNASACPQKTHFSVFAFLTKFPTHGYFRHMYVAFFVLNQYSHANRYMSFCQLFFCEVVLCFEKK